MKDWTVAGPYSDYRESANIAQLKKTLAYARAWNLPQRVAEVEREIRLQRHWEETRPRLANLNDEFANANAKLAKIKCEVANVLDLSKRCRAQITRNDELMAKREAEREAEREQRCAIHAERTLRREAVAIRGTLRKLADTKKLGMWAKFTEADRSKITKLEPQAKARLNAIDVELRSRGCEDSSHHERTNRNSIATAQAQPDTKVARPYKDLQLEAVAIKATLQTADAKIAAAKRDKLWAKIPMVERYKIAQLKTATEARLSQITQQLKERERSARIAAKNHAAMAERGLSFHRMGPGIGASL